MKNSSDCLALLATLLRTGCIPENEMDEAMEHIAPIASYPPDDIELDKSLLQCIPSGKYMLLMCRVSSLADVIFYSGGATVHGLC